MVKKRAARPMGRARPMPADSNPAIEQRSLAHLTGNDGRPIQQDSLLLVPSGW